MVQVGAVTLYISVCIPYWFNPSYGDAKNTHAHKHTSSFELIHFGSFLASYRGSAFLYPKSLPVCLESFDAVVNPRQN